MTYDVAAYIRLEPRLRAILASIPAEPAGHVDSREALLAEANSEVARQQAELFRSFMELCDTEDGAPSAGLWVHTEKVVSEPDGNSINLQVIRPEPDEAVARIYYIHGGGMAALPCYDGGTGLMRLLSPSYPARRSRTTWRTPSPSSWSTRTRPAGSKAHRTQLGDSGPPESVAGLNAAIQVAVREGGWPGAAVVPADFVLQGAVTVDVFHDQCAERHM
jgi:hypothetical protein